MSSKGKHESFRRRQVTQALNLLAADTLYATAMLWLQHAIFSKIEGNTIYIHWPFVWKLYLKQCSRPT